MPERLEDAAQPLAVELGARASAEVEEREPGKNGHDVAATAHAAAVSTSVRRSRASDPWLLRDIDGLTASLQTAVEHFRHASGGEALSNAAEWLLDNAYLAQQAVRQVREDMPRRFYRQLPVLVDGPLAGLPRVYDISQRLVSAGQARLDLEQVRQYLEFYQDERPLTSGELWAIPVMLRLSLLNVLTSALASITGLPGRPALPTLPGQRRIEGQATSDELVGSCFTSLRALATHDWNRFFEAVSRVDAILRQDPPAIYARMDRDARDQYRKAVEQVARATGQTEQDVAAVAVDLAASAFARHSDPGRPLPPHPQELGKEEPEWLARPDTHVGYYLLDAGLPELEAAFGRRPAAWRRLAAARQRRPALLYLGPIFLIAGFLVLGALTLVRAAAAPVWQQLLAALLAIVPALTVSVSLVDWVVTLEPIRITDVAVEWWA